MVYTGKINEFTNKKNRSPDIDYIKEQLGSMVKHVERAHSTAVKAFFESDYGLALMIVGNDKVINSFEIDIDNSTYTYLAINRPGETELRLLLAIQKVNSILERIGDHAVNIAESVTSGALRDVDRNSFGMPEMALLVNQMLHDTLDCFITGDADLAHDILTRDDEIDRSNRAINDRVKEDVKSGRISFEAAVEIIRIAKNLERVADLSTNIAEETIFTTLGVNAKHHADLDMTVEKSFPGLTG